MPLMMVMAVPWCSWWESINGDDGKDDADDSDDADDDDGVMEAPRLAAVKPASFFLGVSCGFSSSRLLFFVLR